MPTDDRPPSAPMLPAAVAEGAAPGVLLYQQLAQALEADIRAGRYPGNTALPSERALCAQWGVSRVTARKALDVLVAQGLVRRRHGAGSFVAPLVEQSASKLASFSQELRQRGYAPSSQWLERAVAAPTPAERSALQLPRGARVARLRRLRLADGVAMALEHSVLPLALLPQPQALQDSLYLHLAQTGAAPVRAVQQVRAHNADAAMAQHLGVAVGAALLWVSRQGFGADGAPMEYTQSYCRSDMYSLVSELRSTV